MSRRRVLFIQTQAENAGAQEVSRLIGDQLAGRGYEVRHLFFYRKSDDFFEPENTSIICEQRPAGIAGLIGLIHSLFKEIRDYRPDCVFCFQHFGNTIGAPIARLAGCRNIIANQVTAISLVNPALVFIDKVFGRTGVYDHITVNSKSLLEAYANHPKSYTDKLSVIPQGFENKTVQLEKPAARARFSLPEDVALLGCTARLNPGKQLDKVISLLPDRPDWHFAIAGQGPDLNRLQECAERLGVTSRVHFVGELFPDQVGPFLAGLDVFAFPSAAESFGLAAVEAAQAGVPVVANTLPVLKEVLQTETGPCADFADVTDASKFAEKIEKILNDPGYAQDLSVRGRALEDRYSLRNMIDTYEAYVIGNPDIRVSSKAVAS